MLTDRAEAHQMVVATLVLLYPWCQQPDAVAEATIAALTEAVTK